MILTPEQSTISYRCPECGQFVSSIVGVFSLTGELIRLKCSCKESELQIKKIDDRIQINVPCFICGKPHIYTISRSALFNSGILTLSCPYSGMLVCFIGGEDEVLQATEDADRELNEILEENGIEDFFSQKEQEKYELDYTAITLAVTVVKELAEDGKIYCGCADYERCEAKDRPIDLLTMTGEYVNTCHGDFILVIEDDNRLVLKCLKCGRSYVIPTENASSMAYEAFISCEHIFLN